MITRIDLHPALAAAASPARAEEWRLSIHALLDDARLAVDAPVSLFVDRDPEGLLFVWLRDGTAVSRMTIRASALQRHLDEYESVCRMLGSLEHDAAGQRLEALDMAKKLAHDDAARTLRALCEPIAPDHTTSRRLFTLVFALLVDTTRLSGAHQRHGP